jgi:AraC-like DNA-binding protein
MSTMTTEISDKWLANPLVAAAADRAGLDPLGTLEALHGMMTDLETACPGVPFGEILASARGEASAEANGKVAGMLLTRGLSFDEVDDTLGGTHEARLEHARDLTSKGSTLSQVTARTGFSRATLVGNGVTRNVETRDKLDRAKAMIANGHTVAAAAADIGVAERTLYRYLAGQMPSAAVTTGAPKWLQIARDFASHGDHRKTMDTFGLSFKGYVYDSHKRAKREGLL